ncbi:hypothetical protein PENTCL1PPCAC_15180, partial [Pristionchus entomophagus]
SLSSPFLAEWYFNAFFVARIIMGLAEGFVAPSMGSMSGRWYPPNDRSTLTGIYHTGSQIGAALASVISAALCGSPWGWHSIFYLFGAIGVVWTIAWVELASDSPSTNKFVSEREAKYLAIEIRRKE